jgi:hypothetical protein
MTTQATDVQGSDVLRRGRPAIVAGRSHPGALTPGATAPRSVNEIGTIPIHHQDPATGAVAGPHRFSLGADLHIRLAAWLDFYYNHTPAEFGWPGRVVLGGGGHAPSLHAHGRAADITRIDMFHARFDIGFDAFNGRHSWWRDQPAMPEYRRRYWGTVAGLSMYFGRVLHYHHDRAHDDHVHVDNAAAGGAYPMFSTGRRSQVMVVQAVCRYVYGQGTAIDGAWGPQTDSHSRAVLAGCGWTGGVRDSRGHWQRFCRAGMHAAHGLPS